MFKVCKEDILNDIQNTKQKNNEANKKKRHSKGPYLMMVGRQKNVFVCFITKTTKISNIIKCFLI